MTLIDKANKVVAGLLAYSDVPDILKPEVLQILKDNKLEFLAE